MTTRQYTKTAEVGTSVQFLPGTDARTNVALDRLIVETYDDTASDTIAAVNGLGETLFSIEVAAGRDTPIDIPLGVLSGSGIKVYSASPATRARAFYFIFSRRHELPNGL